MVEENVDLRFIGQQLQRVQIDLREVQAGLNEVRTDQTKLQAQVHGEISELTTEVGSLAGNLDAFRESVVDRFDQMTNLIKLSFRALKEDINNLRRSD